MRGISFRGGFHDFTIDKGGLTIYPRLIAAHTFFIMSGGKLSGPGSRSSMASQTPRSAFQSAVVAEHMSVALTFAIAAAARGEHTVIFAFDEGLGTIEARARTLGLPLQDAIDSGHIQIQQIDPAEVSPGAFAHLIRSAVEDDNARIIIIDSLNGYLNAMPEERFLILQMHELLTYMSQVGVLTILVLAQHGLVGPMETPIDISYLSDAVIMLRYFEAEGTVRRAISVVKKRSGNHEHTIREFRLTNAGVFVGPPLVEFTGIFSGTPRYTGGKAPLLAEGEDGRH